MHKLNFSFSGDLHLDEREHALEEMAEWMAENGYKHVTHDTLIYNHCNGSPNRYFRIRESAQFGTQYVVFCSHEEVLMHFKLRWSDYWL